MSDEEIFASFYGKSFPAVDSNERAHLSSFLAKNWQESKWIYASPQREYLQQGDIISPIIPYYFDGQIRQAPPGPVVLLENTCNMSVDNGECRNSHYTAAALYPAELYENHPDKIAIKKNLNTGLMYFGNIPTLNSSFIADFGLIISLDAEWLQQSIHEGKVNVATSLSQSGALFFLMKMSVHFLRANDELLNKATSE